MAGAAHAETLPRTYDVVGPICESTDVLAFDRTLAAHEGDVVAILSAGAYGFVMSSNYNSRPRAAEVMVDSDGVTVVRERETFDDLVRRERPQSSHEDL
jgi:diaminopimelate decarboxylase